MPIANQGKEFDRRAFLRTLTAGGAIAWAAPVIVTLDASPAAASTAPTTTTSSSTTTTPPNDVFPFDRRGAVAYSEKWWDKRNSNYDDFSNDCANFVSQCWHEGGLYPFRFDGPKWYHRKSNVPFPFEASEFERTKSWTVTVQFSLAMARDFQVATLKSADMTSSWNGALPGDAIIYDHGTGDGYTHSSVEAGFGSFTYPTLSGDSHNGDYINQHTADRYHAPWNYGWLNESDPVKKSKKKAIIVHFRRD